MTILISACLQLAVECIKYRIFGMFLDRTVWYL